MSDFGVVGRPIQNTSRHTLLRHSCMVAYPPGLYDHIGAELSETGTAPAAWHSFAVDRRP